MGKNSIKAIGSVTTKRTIGLDLGDQYSYFCVLDETGEKVEWGRVKTSGETLEKRFGGEEVARLGRVDLRLLSPIEHRSEEAQADLAVIRGRDALVDLCSVSGRQKAEGRKQIPEGRKQEV